MVGTVPYPLQISLNDLINVFILLDEDKDQIVGSFPYFGLN